jgi:ethanolamine utilization protein EutM
VPVEKAIGLLEVQAMVAAIAGLDAMEKAADVRLIHVEKRLGGRLVTLVIDGTVSAVTAALEAGKAAAAQVGNVKLAEVIARPHPEVTKFLYTD